MEFRAAIEQRAIKRAVKVASDFELLNIKNFVKEMQRFKDDVTAFTKADYNFHLEIYKCSKNKFFYESIENFKREIISCLTVMNAVNDSQDFALCLHEKIADALIERDLKKALNLLNNNGEYNFARMKKLFNKK
jgi:DNA-binding FadR family transcriptional regulator